MCPYSIYIRKLNVLKILFYKLLLYFNFYNFNLITFMKPIGSLQQDFRHILQLFLHFMEAWDSSPGAVTFSTLAGCQTFITMATCISCWHLSQHLTEFRWLRYYFLPLTLFSCDHNSIAHGAGYLGKLGSHSLPLVGRTSFNCNLVSSAESQINGCTWKGFSKLAPQVRSFKKPIQKWATSGCTLLQYLQHIHSSYVDLQNYVFRIEHSFHTNLTYYCKTCIVHYKNWKQIVV